MKARTRPRTPSSIGSLHSAPSNGEGACVVVVSSMAWSPQRRQPPSRVGSRPGDYANPKSPPHPRQDLPSQQATLPARAPRLALLGGARSRARPRPSPAPPALRPASRIRLRTARDDGADSRARSLGSPLARTSSTTWRRNSGRGEVGARAAANTALESTMDVHQNGAIPARVSLKKAYGSRGPRTPYMVPLTRPHVFWR